MFSIICKRDVFVSERFQKHLTLDWTGVFDIDPKFIRRVYLEKVKINNWLEDL